MEQDGQFWRSITYIGAATTSDVIRDRHQAKEVGYGLGMFHSLISDLPAEHLADTLENFHVTPAYLKHFDSVARPACPEGSLLAQAIAFVDGRRGGIDVLEADDFLGCDILPTNTATNGSPGRAAARGQSCSAELRERRQSSGLTISRSSDAG